MYRIKLCSMIIGIFFFTTHIGIAQQKGGRWQFENNGDDTAWWDLTNNSGQLQGEAVFQELSPLQQGSAYLMLDTTWVHDFFKVDDSDDLDFDNENIAISAWIYPLKVGDDVYYILNKGDQFPDTKTTNYALRISKNKTIEFLIRDDQNQAQKVSSSFTITIDQWNFVCMFYNYEAGMVYFWDQPQIAAVDTVNFQQDYFSNNDPLVIGSWFRSDVSQPSIKDFQGRIDDVRIGTEISHIFDDYSSVDGQYIAQKGEFFNVYQSVPNPCNSYTTIPFSISSEGIVVLTIFNIIGQVEKKIELNVISSGLHEVNIDVSEFSSGIYFFCINYQNYSQIKKFIILK